MIAILKRINVTIFVVVLFLLLLLLCSSWCFFFCFSLLKYNSVECIELARIENRVDYIVFNVENVRWINSILYHLFFILFWVLEQAIMSLLNFFYQYVYLFASIFFIHIHHAHHQKKIVFTLFSSHNKYYYWCCRQIRNFPIPFGCEKEKMTEYSVEKKNEEKNLNEREKMCRGCVCVCLFVWWTECLCAVNGWRWYAYCASLRNK